MFKSLSISIKLMIALGAMMSACGVATLVVLFSLVTLQRSDTAERSAYQISEAATLTLAAAVEQQNALRAYVATGQETARRDYLARKAAFDQAAQALDASDADHVYAAVVSNGYGQFDGLIPALTPALGEVGLLQLEEAVLGAIMLEKSAFDVASELVNPSVFYDYKHQRIYSAMMGLQQKNMPIDLLTVVEELRRRGELDAVDGPYKITKLTNAVVSSAHIETHCKILVQKFIKRELIRISGLRGEPRSICAVNGWPLTSPLMIFALRASTFAMTSAVTRLPNVAVQSASVRFSGAMPTPPFASVPVRFSAPRSPP